MYNNKWTATTAQKDQERAEWCITYSSARSEVFFHTKKDSAIPITMMGCCVKTTDTEIATKETAIYWDFNAARGDG